MENQRKEHTVDELTAEIEALRAENERLQQQVDMLKKAVFGPKSEKEVFHDADSGEQLSLFNEAETEARREESEEVTVPAHKRKKKRSRAEILKDLPTDEVINKVEDKTCDKCGGDDLQIRKAVDHIFQSAWMGKVEPLITAMHKKRYLALNIVKHFKKTLIVRVESLGIRMEFYAFQPKPYYPVCFFYKFTAFRMYRAEAVKLLVYPDFISNKFIYMSDLIGLCSDRKDKKA